ncbi:MAG: ester cyclase [Chloroflexi bacterium]|nr:ester cyclase [Chloroflexota bacterium]
MAESIHNQNKERIGVFRRALYDADRVRLRGQLREIFAPDCLVQLANPLETLAGADGLYEGAYAPLLAAVPDLERRDFIVMAGASKGGNWVGCGGHYMGVFEHPWLDIPPTRHLMAMRFHEFFRLEDGLVVEMQALWDIPQVMLLAGAWPLTPSLAPEWVVPGPATEDGIVTAAYDEAQSQASVDWVTAMLVALQRSPEGLAAMQIDRHWHPKMMWYGPAGIGSMRRIAGFRNWHQIPFLKALPDRSVFKDQGIMFGDGDYVAFTGWPGMSMTISGDGWLGIAPANQKITMRSLDFWRCEKGLIRENWVLIDLLHVYAQIGVDVFERMRELTIGRHGRMQD